MAISVEASASAASDSLTLPSHQAGDLLVMLAARMTRASITVPSGWRRFGGRSGGFGHNMLAAKRAGSSSETSGTWTGAEGLICAVLRDSDNYAVEMGPGGMTGYTGSSITFASLLDSDATSTSYNSRMSNSTDGARILGGYSLQGYGIGEDSPPTGFTLIDLIQINTGKSMGLIISDAVQTAAPGAISLGFSQRLQTAHRQTHRQHLRRLISRSTKTGRQHRKPPPTGSQSPVRLTRSLVCTWSASTPATTQVIQDSGRLDQSTRWF
jgi:hypothetical protein